MRSQYGKFSKSYFRNNVLNLSNSTKWKPGPLRLLGSCCRLTLAALCMVYRLAAVVKDKFWAERPPQELRWRDGRYPTFKTSLMWVRYTMALVSRHYLRHWGWYGKCSLPVPVCSCLADKKYVKPAKTAIQLLRRQWDFMHKEQLSWDTGGCDTFFKFFKFGCSWSSSKICQKFAQQGCEKGHE